jgi:hypothetical protein
MSHHVISVSPIATLDPSDPFATKFSVSNEGSLAIKDVRLSCLANAKAKTAEGGRMEMMDSTSYMGNIGNLAANDKATARCNIRIKINEWLTGDMLVTVEYSPSFYPWRQTRKFRFVGERGSDDVLHWFQQPAS